MPPDATPNHARRWLIGLAILPALALAAEAGVRGWQRANGSPYSPEALEAELERAVAAMAFAPLVYAPPPPAPAPGDVLPHPYLGWEPIETRARYAEEARHFASEESALDVLVIGGGGAVDFAARGFGTFAEIVSHDPRFEGREIRCIDMAQADVKQPHQINTVNYVFALGWRPDLILNIDGFDQVVIGFDNFERDGHPTHPAMVRMGAVDTSGGSDKEALEHLVLVNDLQLEGHAVVERCQNTGVLRSALLGRCAMADMRDVKARFDRATEAYDELLADKRRNGISIRGPLFLGHAKAAMRHIVDVWTRASLQLDALSRARSIRYLHVLQPCEYDDGEPAGARRDTEGDPSVWAVRTAYPLMRAEGAELTRVGVELLDASGLAPGNERALAERIAATFLAGGEQ